jgi:diguanylate cyclase (GGDEF)-like protein
VRPVTLRPLPFARRLGAWLLRLLASLLLCGTAQAAPVLAIAPGVEQMSLDGRLELLEDAGRRYDAGHLPGDDAAWRAGSGGALNISFSRSAWWLRLRLRNADPAQAQARLLELGNPRLDDVRWYLLRDGRLAERVETGDRLAFSTRAVPYHGFAFPLALAPGEQAEILLRIDSHDGYFGLTPARLATDRAFRQGVQLHTLLCGLYYGALLILLAYHLCSLRSSRTASFVLYLGYLGTLLLTRVAFEGHAAQYLLPDAPALVNQGLLLTYSATVVLFGALLAVALKDHLATQPRLHVFCWATVALNALPIPLALAGAYAATLKFAIPATFFSTLVGIAVCARAWRQGHRHSRYFLAGSLSVMVGLLAERLRFAGALPDWPVLEYGVAITSVIEALLVAIALSENLNRLKSQKLEAERQARAAEAALNAELGHLVEARTRELAEANGRLAVLAATDELTGAGNRRRFQQEFAAHVGSWQRSAGVIGLCLFDLDHFKRYNDTYGHPAGDEALRRVCACVQGALARSDDRLFRIGGEEFALLLTSGDGAALEAFVDALRQAVEDLALPHAGNEAGRVTASFGLAWTAAPGADPMALYRFADGLLYRAKAGGRNRVAAAAIGAPEGAVAAGA